MLIDEFEVHNYKLFESLKLEGLGRVNLIVGANNVGKTALLEALYLDGRRDLAAAVIDLMRQRKESGEPSVEPSVRRWWGKEGLDLIAGDSNLEIHNRYGRTVLQRTAKRGAKNTQIDGTVTLKKLGDLESEMLPIAERFNDTLAIWQSGLDETLRDNCWDQFVLYGENDQIVQLMQLVEPSIRRIGLKNDGHVVRQPYYLDEAGKEFPLSRLGLGMARLLGLAFGMYFSKNDRLIIDEVETGLYYEVQEKVWAWIFKASKQLGVQVFATTHSLDCVRAFAHAAKVSEEVGRIYRLTRKFGPIRAVKYDENQMQIATEQDIEVR